MLRASPRGFTCRRSLHDSRMNRYPPNGNPPLPTCVILASTKGVPPMKGIIAWLLGVPIVVIVLLYVSGIF